MSYSSEVLADSPAGFWWLDEPSGTTVTDSSGNGHNGSYINTPTLGETGPVSGHTAVLFSNAGSSYAQITTHSSLHVSNSTDPWTLEAWFKGTNGAGDFNGPSILTVIYDGTRVDFNLGFWNGSGVGNQPSVNYYNGAHISSQSATSIADGNWHHLVGTYDGTDLKIYVDKVLKNTATPSAPSTRGTQDLLIGKRWDTGGILDGRVAAVAVYPSALTSTRVTAHYDAASSQTVTITQPTETDTAQAIIGFTHIVNQATETDTAQAITPGRITPISQATETDSTSAPTAVRKYLLNQPQDATTAQTFSIGGTPSQTVTIGMSGASADLETSTEPGDSISPRTTALDVTRALRIFPFGGSAGRGVEG